MEIPIRNIFYLLSYAWEKLEIAEQLEINLSDYHDVLNLLARVLVNCTKSILKQGIDKEYISHTQEYFGVKGKIHFVDSLKKNSFKKGKSVCSFDEFTPNVLQNQIIKTTLKKLTLSHILEPKIEIEIRDLLLRLHDIDIIELNQEKFSQVKIHRNNQSYALIMNIAKLLHENSVIDENNGSYLFSDFTREEKAMAKLFEDFVRNFYSVEQSQFKVRRENIPWDAKPIGNSSLSLLPKMQTDISLESSDKKIIIDTKYYKETLSENFGTNKIHSNNLYQIYSYISNVDADTSKVINKNCAGILLYPTINKELDELFEIRGHKIKISTVDLSKEWRLIHQRLKEIINFDE